MSKVSAVDEPVPRGLYSWWDVVDFIDKLVNFIHDTKTIIPMSIRYVQDRRNDYTHEYPLCSRSS
jgi:hypothetical protein